MKKGKQKIRSHILFPLGFALVILLAISMFLVHLLHIRRINDHTQEHLSNAKKLFQAELNEDAQLLSGLIDFIQRDKNFQDAWLAKDREALLKYTLPVFDNICTKHNITHFYFHGLDRVNFLRVHDPPRHSDHIDRFTMAGAANDRKLTWGIELGPLGTFTLRVVSPWQIDGKLVGYIELGEEIEHITVEISELLGIELCSIINKSYLDRNNWEEGMKMLGRRSYWNQFPGFVITNKTFDKLPPALNKYLEELESCKDEERLTDMLKITIDDHRYQGRFFPLIDAGNQDVGDIIVIADITKAISELRMFSIMLTLSCIVIALLLLGFFYFYLGRIENKLTHSYNEIQDAIAHREQAYMEIASIAKFPSENPYPILRISKDGEVLYSNEAGKLLLAQWNSEVGKTVPEKWRNLIAQAFASGKGKEEKEEEEEVNNRVFSISITPVKEAGYVNLYGRDITKRKQAEDELRQSEERFRRSILESPFPIMIHAEDGEVLQINKVWTELTGYEPEEIPTLSAWTERAYGERKDIVKSRIDKIFDCDTKIEEGEYTIKSKEGKVLIWDFSSAPLGRMPDGRRLVISMAMDVTARKQAEEKEKQHHAELAHASRVNSIGEMASSLAHEINQPLFVMQAQAERSSKLLKTGSQNIDTVIDKMQIIMKQADRAEKIISRIRKFVRKGKSIKQKVSLNALIYDSLELLRNEIAHKNISLQLDLSTDAPEVNTDPVQIEQVIVNLISNAIEALDETLGNERQISIKSSVTEGNAEVRIKDNGSGMSPKEIQLAFDSFYTTKSYGLGIGLSISRTIIESQGGRIGLEDNADKGVTSYFTLPVNKADQQIAL